MIDSRLDEQIVKIKEKVSDLEQTAGKMLDLSISRSEDIASKIRNLRALLSKLHKSYDVKRCFVVVFGALKSGKSTLMNALVGQEISPTGYGRETTLRCSVVMSSDESRPDEQGIRVYRYEQKHTTEDEKKRLAGELLDCFKGVKNFNDLSTALSRSRFYSLHGNDLSKEQNNLSYILTSTDLSGLQNFRDFFLAELRIPETKDGLLSEDIALVDMPGLDGVNANIDVDPLISQLMLEAHYYILVHSSVAALNKTTLKAIKSCVAHNSDTPTAILLNVMKSKPWRSELTVQKDEKECEEYALKSIEGIVPNPLTFTLNLAQAWDAENSTLISQDFDEEYIATREGMDKPVADTEKLFDESRLGDFRNELIKKISTNRMDMIIDKANKDIKNLCADYQQEGNWLKELLNQLNHEKEEIEKKIELHNKIRDKIIGVKDSLITDLQEQQTQYSLNDIFTSEFKNKPDTLFYKLRKELTTIPVRTIDQKFTKDEAKKITEKYLENIWEKAREFWANNNEELNNKVIHFFADKIRELEDKIERSFSNEDLLENIVNEKFVSQYLKKSRKSFIEKSENLEKNLKSAIKEFSALKPKKSLDLSDFISEIKDRKSYKLVRKNRCRHVLHVLSCTFMKYNKDDMEKGRQAWLNRYIETLAEKLGKTAALYVKNALQGNDSFMIELLNDAFEFYKDTVYTNTIKHFESQLTPLENLQGTIKDFQEQIKSLEMQLRRQVLSKNIEA